LLLRMRASDVLFLHTMSFSECLADFSPRVFHPPLNPSCMGEFFPSRGRTGICAPPFSPTSLHYYLFHSIYCKCSSQFLNRPPGPAPDVEPFFLLPSLNRPLYSSLLWGLNPPSPFRCSSSIAERRTGLFYTEKNFFFFSVLLFSPPGAILFLLSPPFLFFTK